MKTFVPTGAPPVPTNGMHGGDGRASLRCLPALAAGLLLAGALGCSVHVPPKSVAQDRFAYTEAIAESWKRQTLINIVHLRYADAPTFMEVASIINSYSTSATVSGSGELSVGPGEHGLNAGGARSWSNTPTVTYQPLTGQKFTAGLLRPLPPAAVFQMIEAGWSVPLIFRTGVRSLNGISNQNRGRRADPRFDRLVEALERLQDSQALNIRIEERKEGATILIVLRRESIAADLQEDLRVVRELLGLGEGSPAYTIVFGSVPANSSEIAVLTRSMLEIMLEVASGVDVPPSDLAEGRAVPGRARAGELPAEPLIGIHYGTSVPADAFVSVPYRNLWFWIEDTDVASKAKFTFLMILFSLAESGPPSAGPVVTVNAGG